MMTYQRSVLAVSTALFSACAAWAQTPPPLRIMPLGDSITYGSSTPGGYRLPLYTLLNTAGYNVDYIGTQTGNGAAGLPDSDHEGHGGWTIGGIDGSILSWLDSIADPDVILLHIGTNDSGAGDFSNRVTQLNALVNKIVTKRPFAHVIVTTLLMRGEPNYTAITNYFNPYISPLVADQRAQGHNRVHYLDMHAYLGLTNTYDNLHPNAGGYTNMANAWLPAITNILSPVGDGEAPGLSRATGATNHLSATVTFSKPVAAASATNIANYLLSGGVVISNAALSADQRTVTLTTSLQASGTLYTLTVNHVTDLSSPAPLSVADNSTITFIASSPRGYSNYVPESSDYTLVYSVDLPTTPNFSNADVPYSVNNAAYIGSFTRVAYYLELQKEGEDLQHLWVSMDAFTNRADKLGLPTFNSGAVYQQLVNNMNIYCNVPGVVTGTGITTGNIEFWPWNYSDDNAKGIPNASNDVYDFGDTCSYNFNYSCMQVHNYGASQTLFALNHWNGGPLEIGIGNQPTGNPDWTFANNGGNYLVKTLQVLVLRNAGDTTPPTALSAQAGIARDLITVTFDEPLSATTVEAGRFSVDHDVAVIRATLQSDQRTVNLLTSRQPATLALTLSIQGIRDTSPNANEISAGTTIAVSAPGLPPEIVTNIGTNAGDLANGYELVYSLDLPTVATFNSNPDFYRYNQSNLQAGYNRIAYYLELQAPGSPAQYVWTSMDAFTSDASKIGLPVNATGAVFQQYVSNLVVKSNVAGVSNGNDFAAGNIEFWASNYDAVNSKGIPGANDTACDFGDNRGANTGAGHGCMQVHNYLATQTVFAVNHFGTDNNIIGLGIGSRPGATASSDPDWTFTYNAGNYSRRVLHVMVKPTAPPALPPEVASKVPQAEGYYLAYTVDLPIYGDFYTNSQSFYRVNNYTNGLPTTFSRIAYYLELVPTGSTATQFLWTAMDAFTTDARRIAVPTNNCVFRQNVNDLEVFSNAEGISNNSNFASGFIEFWPSDYGDDNTYPVPGASSDAFDFGDSGGAANKGYGCMQVHNYGSLQTLFAINHFNDPAARICVGIGNSPIGQPDWTFRDNANQYDYRRLHVLVLPGAKRDPVRPWVVNAAASRALNQVSVRFNEALANDAATPSFYTLSNSLTITGAKLLPDKKTVILDTSDMTAGQTNTLTVSHVRDASVSANEIALYTRVSFIVPSGILPAVLTNAAETAEYELIHQLAVGNTANYQYGCTYTVDQSLFTRTQAIDRVAYCMELQNAARGYHWVYVSMNAFTDDITKIGVPTADRATLLQMYVSNLNIYASANIADSAVTTGVGITSGNIEFWPSNYGGSNDKNIPGALGVVNGTNVFDFGDGGGPSILAGHGSMQVHNYLKGHTIFAMNRFGANNQTPCLGIGNNTNFTQSGQLDPDWTFYSNAGQYTTKNIYVLAKPGAPLTPTPTGSLPTIWDHPKSLSVLSGQPATFTVYAPDAFAYQWRKNGQRIEGATGCILRINPTDLGDNGIYDVLAYGSGTVYAVSQSATLKVYPLGSVLRLR